MIKNPTTLKMKSSADAVADAKSLIDQERSGRIAGLFTRWRGVNRAFMRYSRFGKVTMIAGASGSGKSAILNMIENDFINPDLNPTFIKHLDRDIYSPTFGQFIGEDKVMILAFKYEMSAGDEVLRTVSGKLQKSYGYLLSSEIIGKEDESGNLIKAKDENGRQVLDKNGKPIVKALDKEVYNKIDDKEFAKISSELDNMSNRQIMYIESAGNLEQLYLTCAKFKEENPHLRLVVTLDHTLLSVKLSERDDGELIAATAHVADKLKKGLNANVIFLAQLNGEIEKPLRRDNPSLHFPVKTDIHWGGQIYWACDYVFIYHRPELLGIEKYSHKHPANTKKLIHMACIKSRGGKIGNVWFKEEFEVGNVRQVEFSEVEWHYDPNKI